jgi:site-specific DNA recombinase
MEGVLRGVRAIRQRLSLRPNPRRHEAALELGRWIFLAPLGYLNAPRAIGKSLIADPERALLVRRAFEEYATGRHTKEQLLKQTSAWA